MIKATGLEYNIAVIVDNVPGIIQLVTDGAINNGRNIRKSGWGRYTLDMKDFSFGNLETINLAWEAINIKSQITKIRLYNRPLLNTEIICNHAFFKSNKLE